MPFPIIPLLGAAVGAIGAGVGASSQAEQQKKNRELTRERTQYFQDIFSQQQAKTEQAFGAAKTSLGETFGGAQERLQELFTAQGGQFQNILADIQQSGRQQAAQSGLIGGGVESALVSPAIERTSQAFGTQAAGAQLGLEQQFAAAMAALQQANVARQGSVAQTALKQAGGGDGGGPPAPNPLTAGFGGAFSGFGAGLDIQRYIDQLK